MKLTIYISTTAKEDGRAILHEGRQIEAPPQVRPHLQARPRSRLEVQRHHRRHGSQEEGQVRPVLPGQAEESCKFLKLSVCVRNE